MKKSLFLLFFIVLFIGCGTTQQTVEKAATPSTTEQKATTSVDDIIPTDKDLIIGKLDNGLTYYIKHNDKPENKVELRLAVNAGSVVEDDDQQGLAHFMEHMNFNGLKHFPKNELVDYLQSIGVRFGADLNAYTSFDETIYMLPIPLDDPKNLDTGLTVLHDWAHYANLTGEEIDKERGVVLEEYRLGLGADKRMLAKWLPVVYKGSKYAERLPIGKKEILENFDHETLRRFHKDWYRTDLEAVIVVGDIDPKEIEAKIKKVFSEIPASENPRKRETYYIPNHEGTLISVASDKEAGTNVVRIEYRDQDNYKQTNSVQQYKEGIVEGLFSTMMRNRFRDLAENENPPFSFAFAFRGTPIGRTKQSYSTLAYTDVNKKLDALKTMLHENNKVLQHGFTQAELDRAKMETLTRYEQFLKNKNTEKSNRIIGQYVRNFLENEPLPSVEWEYETHKNYLPQITLQQVNDLAKKFIHKDNRAIVITGMKKDGVPDITEEQVRKIVDEIDREKVDNLPQEKALATSLMEQKPTPGKIVKEEKNEDLGTTTLYLDNGAKVVYKKTDFKNDEVKIRGFKYGGRSVLDLDLLKKINYALNGVPEAGYNGLKKSDIRKILAGKKSILRPIFGNNVLQVMGETRPKDLEVLFQQVYLNQTKVNKDPKAFESWKARQAAFLSNLANMPDFKFMLAFDEFVNQNNPRYFSPLPSKEDLERQDYDAAYDNYTKYFYGANDFNYYFVGNFDEQKLRDYAQTYIGAIPNNQIKGAYKKHDDYSLKGFKEFIFKAGKDPKSQVNILYHGQVENPTENEALHLKALGKILDNKLVERIREKESGVYGVSARGSLKKVPRESYTFRINFPCGPDNARKLIASTMDEIDKLVKNGPSVEDLNKIKKELKVQLEEKQKDNDYWVNYLFDTDYENADPERIKRYFKLYEEMTPEDIQKVAVKYLKNAKNRVIGIWYPEGYEEKK